MSKEAMDWALELAPPMPAQLVATLSGLARHADKKGRGAYPSVARLAAYTCKAERSVQRDLKQLRDLGLIRLGDQTAAAHLPEGKRPDVYDLAVERTVPGGRAGSDEVTRTSRVTLASSRRRGGKKKASSDSAPSDLTGDVDVRGDVDVTGDADVADGVTSTSQEGRRGRHPNQKTEPKAEPKDSYGARGSARGPDGDEERDYAWKLYGDFWLLYPKPRQPEKTKTAWRAALDRGADPGLIVKAAKAYAQHLGGKVDRYTPYSATWLNNGSYDDPLPHADDPSGEDGPYRNHDDSSRYHEGW
ncbi:helix-turn-helix domain-containing protein [Streptomyces sp. NPDC059786]|uniref:helix-turn-helix domain-containing protein n=1 Tax=Streptomyces sp. NPDC059786 TaxID=3346946 RepID=UPI00365F5335